MLAICTDNEAEMVKIRVLESNTEKYFFIKMNGFKGYRFDLIPKNTYFYNIIVLNLQKNTF